MTDIEQSQVVSGLLRLQKEKVLKAWTIGGVVFVDRVRPEWEHPERKRITWERAAEIVRLGTLERPPRKGVARDASARSKAARAS